MYFLSCVEIKTISILLLLLLLLLLLSMDFIHASFEAKTVILIDVGLKSVGIIKPVWSLATNQFCLIGRFHTYRDRLSVEDG